MNRLLLIFLLLITFNANSIAGSVMMSSMDNMQMSMSEDCYGDMQSGMDMTDHCETDSTKHEGCDESNCGACVYHCSSAVIERTDSKTVLDSSLPEFQYLLTVIPSAPTKMLRPPKAA